MPSMLKRLFRCPVVCLLLLLVTAGSMLFQLYAHAVTTGRTPVPAWFGNRQAVVDALPHRSGGDEFTFVVVGDTKGFGTFERLSAKIKDANPDFIVLLGDIAHNGTEDNHAYLRKEMGSAINFNRPTFFIAGNHDVRENQFPIARFEQIYGPTNFFFEYGGCLFIGLRFLDAPHDNAASWAFIQDLAQRDLTKYRYRFLMMHIPPPVSDGFVARTYPESEALITLIRKMGIDYVLAGDYHGYCRTQIGRTTYLVTGGGGNRLNETLGPQFHHAVMLHVAPAAVTEKILAVSPTKKWRKKLERAVFVDLAPFYRRYSGDVLIAINLLLLIAMGVMVFRR